MKTKQVASAGATPQPAIDALAKAALQHLRAERLMEARLALLRLLAADPDNASALHHLGLVEHRLGRSGEAIRLIGRALRAAPENARAHADLAVILMAERREPEAMKACQCAIALDPDLAAAHAMLGNLKLRLGYFAEADAAFLYALELQPALAAAHAGRAELLASIGRLDDAETSCRLSLLHAPPFAEALAAKGLIHYKRGRMAEAAAAFHEALRLDPGFGLVHIRLGNIHHAEGRFERALAAYERAIVIEPERAEFHCNKALALQALRRFDDAFAAYSAALALKPDFADALTRLGTLLNQMRRPDEAIATLKHAAEIAPRSTTCQMNLAAILKENERWSEAAEPLRAALALGDTPSPAALYEYCHLRRHLCDWDGLEEAEYEAIGRLKASGERVPPFGALAMAATPQDHLDLARIWADGYPADASGAAGGGRKNAPKAALNDQQRIRIGYLSTDFYDHATASLAAELFERHDRARFEIFAYCASPDDGSAMRQRLIAAFDHFTSLHEHSHLDAAQKIAGDGIDILIDLKGYTQGARTIVMAQRPAPIQVNYLGYPSTMGAAFIDYIIGDPFVTPMAHQAFFDERIVQLPDCYQPNDRQRRTADMPRARSDYGLPEDAFVFCAFNNVYKITAGMFSLWMRLLCRTPGSVLWLLDTNDVARANLRREAESRGVTADRLIFASKLPIAEHQARYAFADLFLDNLPVNAHTTASEALWAGLPVVTCAGGVFVGRVAGSLLHACGLPELVTYRLEDYEALALRLVADRDLLGQIRERLARNRLSAPLFDIERYARNLERAYEHMVRLHRAGEPPQAFAVAD